MKLTLYIDSEDRGVIETVARAIPSFKSEIPFAVTVKGGEVTVSADSDMVIEAVSRDLAAAARFESCPPLPASELARQQNRLARDARMAAEPEYKQAYFDAHIDSEREVHELWQCLRALRDGGQRSLAILAPHPRDPFAERGTAEFRRIKMLEEDLFHGISRVYIYHSPDQCGDDPIVRYYGDDCAALIYNGCYAAQRALVREFVSACGNCFIEGVSQLMPLGGGRSLDLFGVSGATYYYDAIASAKDFYQQTWHQAEADAAREAERVCALRSDYIIAVNRSLGSYLETCRADSPARLFELPLYHGSIPKLPTFKRTGTPVVIYSGDLLPYEKPQKMLKAANSSAAEELEFRFYTHRCDELRGILAGSERLSGAAVSTLDPETSMDELKTAHYFFWLREDCELSRYECDPVLVELIELGVLPIMDSGLMGDFVDDGLLYLTLEDFVAGRLPTPWKRDEMALKNRRLLPLMLERYDGAVKKLRALFSGD